MSGISPASCWATHKRLESWARAAKQRALGHHSSKDSSRADSTASTGSINSIEDFNIEKELLTGGGSTSSGAIGSSGSRHSTPNSSAQSLTAELLRAPLDIAPSTGNNASASPPPLQHQSRSYPGGPPLLCRTPSVSSQSSLDSTASKQGGGNNSGSHRGSSPAIRTFAPDGGRQHPEAGHASSYPIGGSGACGTGGNSRSPSPLRAASLDIRCGSPATTVLHELRTPSPSQASLASLTGSPNSSCNSPVPASPRTATLSRCLSPLLIHSTRMASSDSYTTAPPASPLGAIQPDLYVKKNGPLFIGGIAGKSSSAGLGRLHFRLSYDFDKSDFIVHLIEAHDLAPCDQGGFTDPYVRVSLLPEVDARKRQTSIHRNNPNPLFDQMFKFPVSHEELQFKTLVLQVFDYDRFSRNDIIGEVTMNLSDVDIANSIEIWGEIARTKKPKEDIQEVLISLSYLPSAERVTVVLLKARNLFLSEAKESLDPFVKVYLQVNGKRVKKKKTASKKGSCNPVWNEALTFSLSSSNVPNAAIEVLIFDQGNDLIGTNPLIGSCVIGPKESGPERDHWIDMMHSPRKAVACWHTVR
ncbi:unnamed protein product [Acanthoscelides obtectus]|uniref:C2 domain-containing protein n=1 Tax=Acanthoscelides obtectus TaxID=200917 RepID=A0A9P0K868_ACAOB|nr:unnamed protein product [Acanthoscelides obtectus]CAK1631190.1 Synaptotagmin-C [Acanthoscelides obtectus]